MGPLESLKALLEPAEYEHLVGTIAQAPPSSIVSMWVERCSSALIVVTVDGAPLFHLSIYATDADAGEEMSSGIEAQLARNFAAMRDAAAAARLLLRRIAGSGDSE